MNRYDFMKAEIKAMDWTRQICPKTITQNELPECKRCYTEASVSCKDCPTGYHQDAAGAADCKSNVCTCPTDSSLAATGTDCTSNGLEKCTGCATGQVLNSGPLSMQIEHQNVVPQKH